MCVAHYFNRCCVSSFSSGTSAMGASCSSLTGCALCRRGSTSSSIACRVIVLSIYIYIYICVYVEREIYRERELYIHIYIYIYTYTYTYIYLCIYIYIYTHMYTYTYMYMCIVVHCWLCAYCLGCMCYVLFVLSPVIWFACWSIRGHRSLMFPWRCCRVIPACRITSHPLRYLVGSFGCIHPFGKGDIQTCVNYR